MTSRWPAWTPSNSGTATGHWSAVAHILVTGASAEEATSLLTGVALAAGRQETLAVAISGAITVKMTGQTTNAADEITSKQLSVELIPA